MAHLTEEQRVLIKSEVDKCLKESEAVIAGNEKVLSDLAIYKWILRAVFVTLLGGSIAGVLVIPSWIDNFVAARIRAIDELMLANGNLQSGDFRAAYDNMSAFISELGTRDGQPWDLSKLSDSQRNYFFSTLLQVFVYNSSYDPSNLSEFRSKDRWRSMLKDPEFQKRFPAGESGYSASPRLNLFMGLSYLRYGDSQADLEQAYQYLHYFNSLDQTPGTSVAQYSTSQIPQYSATKVEGLVLALLGRRDEAIKAMASDAAFIQLYSPFLLSYSDASAQMLLGDFDGSIFKRLWKKFSKANYDKDICSLIHAAYIENVSSQMQALKGTSDRADFLKKAMATYAQVQDAVQRKDYDSVYEMLEFHPPQSQMPRFVAKATLLDTSHMSASIYSAQTTPSTPAIVVRFFPVSSAADLDAKESCSGLEPHANKEEFWTFHKRDASDQDWKISFFSPPIQ